MSESEDEMFKEMLLQAFKDGEKSCSGRHHGVGIEGICPRELHHHHDEKCLAGFKGEIYRLRKVLQDIIDCPWDCAAPGLSCKERARRGIYE